MGTAPVAMMKAPKREYHPNEELMSVLEQYHVVRVEDSEFNQKLVWCLANCQKKFRDLSDRNCRAWYFEHEQDAIMFAMRWGSD
jgi:hypothetical protein